MFFALFGLGILAERFGLLNIIVLKEVLLSAALAIQAISKSGHWTADLVFVWGYAHFFVFAAAAIGSGFAALVDASGDHPHGDAGVAMWAVSLSVAVYIAAI